MNVVLLHIENYPKNLIFKNNPYNTVIYVTNSDNGSVNSTFTSIGSDNFNLSGSPCGTII